MAQIATPAEAAFPLAVRDLLLTILFIALSTEQGTGTLQFAVPPLTPHPQFQNLALLVDLVPVHPITRPLQDSCEFVVRGNL